MNTVYDRIQTMTKDELTTFLRNIYLMGVLDERRNGALGSIDFYCNIPKCHYDDAQYPLTLHEVFELYSIVHTPPLGHPITFGVFKSWDDAFEYISNHSYYTLTRTSHNIFRDGYDAYEIIKL